MLLPLATTRFIVDQSRLSAAGDLRIRLLASMLTCMRAIKLAALEKCLTGKYLQAREKELSETQLYQQRYFKTGWAANVLFSLIRAATLATYALYCKYSGKTTLTYSNLFVALAVLQVYQTNFFQVNELLQYSHHVLNELVADRLEYAKGTFSLVFYVTYSRISALPRDLEQLYCVCLYVEYRIQLHPKREEILHLGKAAQRRTR